jgi:DNA-binding response OmpR family regulator
VVILVAEDEALTALALELALAAAGHRVLGPAATVEEALRLAGEDRPDLGLVDIVLSGDRDGIALARALRDRHGAPSLFLSGQTLQARAARDAAWGLVRKPYDPAVVVRAVAGVGEIMLGRRPGCLPRELELFREV